MKQIDSNFSGTEKDYFIVPFTPEDQEKDRADMRAEAPQVLAMISKNRSSESKKRVVDVDVDPNSPPTTLADLLARTRGKFDAAIR